MMAWICFSSVAIAAEMAPEYLHGNWVIGTAEQKCGDADAEYFVFNENGTFEAGRSGKAEAVGFWQIDSDIVYLVFIASGGFFQDIHAELKEHENTFDYFDVKLITFNVKDNRFEAVGVLGDEVNKGIAIRCK
jgi:hypothetical protein